MTLWAKTPIERQQRFAEELSGKKRREENSEVLGDGGRGSLETWKRKKTEAEIQRAIAEHNVRGFTVSVFLPVHVIVEENSSRFLVADAHKESGNSTTKVEEG